MVLLRRVIGDALRSRRQGQQRTLREVSSAANVSLGYLSEVERGQKEPSSELLAAICDALGARLSELLREVSDNVAVAEQLPGVLVPVQDRPALPETSGAQGRPASRERSGARERSGGKDATSARQRPARQARPASEAKRSTTSARRGGSARVQSTAPAARTDVGLRTLTEPPVCQISEDGTVAVSVRQDSPLKTTLRATRRVRTKNERDVVRAA